MPAPRKTRLLRLADGSGFRIAPRTVTVDVSDLPTYPPVLRLHMNSSSAAVELPPQPDGTPQLPVRLTAHGAADLVGQINRIRTEEATARAEAPALLELPPIIAALARYTALLEEGSPPLGRVGVELAYHGKDRPTGVPQVLYVNTKTGKCRLCTAQNWTKAGPHVFGLEWKWRVVSRREAVVWMRANAYPFLPAALVGAPTTGVANETPPASG